MNLSSDFHFERAGIEGESTVPILQIKHSHRIGNSQDTWFGKAKCFKVWVPAHPKMAVSGGLMGRAAARGQQRTGEVWAVS